MLRPTEIDEFGERHAAQWLTARGYRCHHTQRQTHSDFEARGGENSLLVQVNTAMAPRMSPEISQHDHDSLCSRAMMLGFDPWLARVQIDDHGDLVGDIVWSKLK
jgi:hypothetical protein